MTNSEDVANFQRQVLERLDELKHNDDQSRHEFELLNQKFGQLDDKVGQLDDKVDRFNEKFENYQKAMQWVVQLAFSLIATATVTIIVFAVLSK